MKIPKIPRLAAISALFSLLCASPAAFAQSAPPATPAEQKVISLVEDIEKGNRLVSELTEENLKNLPIGVKKTIGNNQYIVAIDSAVATDRGTFVSAYAMLTLNNLAKGPRKIAFAAKAVHFTATGIEANPESRLVLVSPQRFDLSEQVALILPDDGHNYVEWDCNGFKSVNLKGIFEFSDKIFKPSKRLAAKESKVQGAFEINTSDLTNILISVSITPFELFNIPGLDFEVKEAAWDMSDSANPPDFAPPAGYAAMYGDDISLWQGFFLKSLNIHLPAELGNRQLEASNMLIDEYGLTGSFSASDILTIKGEKANASGWPMSIDKLFMNLTAGKLSGGGMNGVLSIPFLNSDTLGYKASITSGASGLNYAFTAAFAKGKTYDCPLGGTLTLNKGCSIGFTLTNGRFMPAATLNGKLNIHNKIVNMDSLKFEKLYLTAEAPYIQGGTFAHTAEHGFKLAGFGISVSDLSLAMASGKATLGVMAKVAFMNESDKGIGGDAHFNVKAAIDESQHWKYEGLNVDEVGLHCKLSLFSLDGHIGLYQDHPTYGDGFSGSIDLKIDKMIDPGIKAEIRFGTVNDFKYWYAKVGVPIIIPMGYVTIEGIRGGAYHHMTKSDLHDFESDYKPDKTTSMGFMAGVGLSVIKEKLIYGDIDFEIAFNNNWGVRFIQFLGDVRFFSGKAKKGTPPVRAKINMFYDFDNSIFHANTKTFMNIVDVIKGSGEGGLLGEAVIHSAPGEWYVYIGRPSVPLGVDLFKIAQAQAYFMAGTKVEDLPLPPATVRSVLNGIDLDFMKKENAVSTGRGMGFGVRFDVNVDFGRDKGFVYAALDLGAGADILLRDYGDAECYGRDGTIGIDGWYASGQSYVYMQGKVGIRVKKHAFDILSLSMATLMQAKLPNPTWMHGAVGAKYSVLGGLVKGKVTVDVVVGEECKIVGNGGELGDIQLIGDVIPAQGAKDVDVFVAPQVAFNTAIDTEFSMMNVYDETNTYRVKFDEFKIVRNDKNEIVGTVKWNEAKDVAVLQLPDILPGTTDLSASVKIHIEKKSGRTWEPLTLKSGAVEYETKVAAFTTGAAPTTVPENNVMYSYPLRNQYNFHTSESNNGYIKLRKGQPDLFYNSQNGSQWTYVARFKSNNGEELEKPVAYDKEAATIRFDIPNGMLASQVYDMQIVRQQLASGTIDQNAKRSETQINTGNAGDSTLIAQNRLEGALASGGEKVLHELTFRSSNYPNFRAKLDAMRGYREIYAVENSLMSLLGIEGSMSETFDAFEMNGQGMEMQPLVQATAISEGNNWLSNIAYPLVYELYGSDQNLKLERDINVLGLMPLKAMWLFNNPAGDNLIPTYQLTDNQKTSGEALAVSGMITCRYNIAYYVNKDFMDLRDKAAAYYVGTGRPVSEQAKRLLTRSLPDISAGRYRFRIDYCLPGTSVPTSGKEYGIDFLNNN